MTTPITKVGKYEILEQVGEGAMGIVYKAKDPILNRTVAIKVMSEGMAHDQALRERFLREAQAAGSLQHPNVVTIYDFGETDGHLFIAMEFIQGADLEHLLKHNAPISLAAKLDIIIDVLNGLSYAHRRGVVHRDIKPANIRVDDEGHARIMDFGVARLATSNLTNTGVMMGTPNYMAPEQISGESVTPSVDLFSAAAVLFELLTNAKPFQGDTLHSVLWKIVSEPTPDLHTLQPGLPSALNEIVRKGMAKDPADRYKSAAEFANALSVIRSPLGAARVSKTVSQRVSIEKGLQAQADAQKRARARHRMQMVGGGIGALLVVAAGGLFAMRWAGKKPGATSTAPAPVVAAGTPALAVASATPAPDTTRHALTPPPVVRASEPPRQTAATTTTKQATKRAEFETKRPAPTVAALTPRVATETKASETKTSETNAPVAAAPAAVQGTSQAGQSTTAANPLVVTPPVAPPSTVTVAPKIVPPETTAENATAAIQSLIASYARAIGTRDVGEVRRVYVGMTPQQQAQWQSFFGSVRTMSAQLQVASMDIVGSTATAKLTGAYEYTTRSGRTERQPVSFEATLLREGDRWRLQAVR